MNTVTNLICCEREGLLFTFLHLFLRVLTAWQKPCQNQANKPSRGEWMGNQCFHFQHSQTDFHHIFPPWTLNSSQKNFTNSDSQIKLSSHDLNKNILVPSSDTVWGARSTTYSSKKSWCGQHFDYSYLYRIQKLG